MEDTLRKKIKHLFHGKGFRKFIAWIIVSLMLGIIIGQFLAIRECYNIAYDIFIRLNLEPDLAKAISEKFGYIAFDTRKLP